MNVTLEILWKETGFTPNPEQEKAIKYIDGPLLLTAGPGSGKTRVLLWRTLNLLVFHKVAPEKIFLSTFTEKAARQLKDGLGSLLGLVTNKTGVPFDISAMSIGTVHSLCQKILSDRRFNEGKKNKPPLLMDELSQYFLIYKRRFWKEIIFAGGFDEEETAQRDINSFFGNNSEYNYGRHEAAQNIIRLFNRLSEENINPAEIKTSDKTVQRMLKMYSTYLNNLSENKKSDFSLIQQFAYRTLLNSSDSQNVFEHVIIDEYQDTNAIQEKIIFELAKGSKNICVVGDDDQALYRFRGATVENLVDFESRCESYLNTKPERIDLSINYRSKKNIVSFYSDFMEQGDWVKEDGKGFYRIADKGITAFNQEDLPSVAVSEKDSPEIVCEEIALKIKELKQTGKIEDYNQVAFLFPAVKGNARVNHFKNAFDKVRIPVYAPRAGKFLEVDEAMEIYGLLFKILGRPSHQGKAGRGIKQFREWTLSCINIAEELIKNDFLLAKYIKNRIDELAVLEEDYEKLLTFIQRNKLSIDAPLDGELLLKISKLGISEKAKKTLTRKHFFNLVTERFKEGDPLSLKYAISRATSVDWTLLDLFYQLLSFRHFTDKIDLAEKGIDEGPICNLSMISGYLARYMEDNRTVISASFIREKVFIHSFFSSYTYAIYRLGETEFEDEENPFPKGRISFLTIHQSKGLEFPVVVLGSLYRGERDADVTEKLARELTGKTGEPIDKISYFDNLRMFYVALSRAKNLLILPDFCGRGQRTSEYFKPWLEDKKFPKLKEIDIKNDVPAATISEDEVGKNYSYTADYIYYHQCPRKYMVFRKYGFAPSTVQTISFGSLVHNTIEDLHHMLINQRMESVHAK